MKRSLLVTKFGLLASALLALPQISSAAIVANYNGGAQAGTQAFVGQISASDLVETGSAALSSVSVSATIYSGSSASLNNGIAIPNPGDNGGATSDVLYGLPDLSTTASITFNLNTSVNTLGYDITSINSFAAWPNQNAGSQQFELLVQSVGSSSFVSLGTFSNVAGFSYFDSLSSLTSLADSTGTIGSGVSALQLIYSQPATGAPAVNIQEIDIQGSATVPEPSALALLALGGGIFFLHRSRCKVTCS